MRRIVADSSANLFEFGKVDYTTVPLKIRVDQQEFVDDENLDVEAMLSALEKTTSPSTTSCPSTGEWLEAFEGADEIFAITISSKLSGSYNSAELAKEEYMSENENAKVHVFDSKETGPGMRLIIEKINELTEQGCSFEETVEKVTEYMKTTNLCFLLHSVNNLARNGRVNILLAKLIGALDIKMLGRADDGVIDAFGKYKGERKAIKETMTELLRMGYKGGKVRIDHVLNLDAAEKLKSMIKEQFPNSDVIIGTCKGLCGFYAERRGMIIGYEC